MVTFRRALLRIMVIWTLFGITAFLGILHLIEAWGDVEPPFDDEDGEL